jgi:hypothetical protein
LGRDMLCVWGLLDQHGARALMVSHHVTSRHVTPPPPVIRTGTVKMLTASREYLCRGPHCGHRCAADTHTHTHTHTHMHTYLGASPVGAHFPMHRIHDLASAFVLAHPDPPSAHACLCVVCVRARASGSVCMPTWSRGTSWHHPRPAPRLARSPHHTAHHTTPHGRQARVACMYTQACEAAGFDTYTLARMYVRRHRKDTPPHHIPSLGLRSAHATPVCLVHACTHTRLYSVTAAVRTWRRTQVW